MILRRLPWALWLFVLAAFPATEPRTATPDPAAAERQYRVARRLAAERSPEASGALERVLALDPDGELADDALVELALLGEIPRWPESIGNLAAPKLRAAAGLLEDVIRRLPQADRTPEARYYRALLRVEPTPDYDVSAARVDLTAVATGTSAWAARARYGLAWLHEHDGWEERARDAYQRLIVDDPRDPAAARARVGLARLSLRRARFGSAARWLQEAVDAGAGSETQAVALRELAVRSLLREAGAADPGRFEEILTGVRALSGFAPTGGGGLLLGDRKQDRVVELDAQGRRTGEWTVEDVQLLVVDPRGRKFVAAGGAIYRLETGGGAQPVASLGDYAPVSHVAVDARGNYWLLEKRGRRIGRISPGGVVPQPFWEDRNGRLTALAWDGRRLVAVDGKNRSVVTLDEDGTLRSLFADPSVRPAAIACDPAGRLAILDGKTGHVWFVAADGTPESAVLAYEGATRPIALGLGPRGELHLIQDSGIWAVHR